MIFPILILFFFLYAFFSYSGQNFLNGFQCTHTLPHMKKIRSHSFLSSLCHTSNGTPLPYILKLKYSEYIYKVMLKYGDLVDSITLHIRNKNDNNERVFVVGGKGGGMEKTLLVPENWGLIGFSGGVGGHVHNLGVYFNLCFF